MTRHLFSGSFSGGRQPAPRPPAGPPLLLTALVALVTWELTRLSETRGVGWEEWALLGSGLLLGGVAWWVLRR